MIRDLESWAAQIVALYEGAENMEGADDLQTVVTCYIHDLRRKMQGETGTLTDLPNLKSAIRLAGFILQAIQDDEPEAMSGWRYLSKPSNIVQDTCSLLYEIAQRLTACVWSIECKYPASCRRVRKRTGSLRASLDQFDAETTI